MADTQLHSTTEEDHDIYDYAPESPDLSGETAYEPDAVHPQHQNYRASISLHSPYTPVDVKSPFGTISGPRRRSSYFGAQAQALIQQQQQLLRDRGSVELKEDIRDEEMAMGDDDEFVPEGRGSSSRAKRAGAGAGAEIGNGSAGEVEVRTKFPVARIKRIMQADEDVGKVAQVTPHAVSKALELFMISLVTKAATEARHRGSKRVLPTHLKQVVVQNDQFDFLNDIVGKIADAPAPKHEDSDDEGHGKKRKPAARKKRKGSEDL